MKSLSPVFNNKSGDTAELARVRCDQDQFMVQSDSGDLQVIRADDVACRFEVITQTRVFPRGQIIKAQRDKWAQQAAKDPKSILHPFITVGTRPKLTFHHRASQDVGWSLHLDPRFESSAWILQMLNPNAGVEQVSHDYSSKASSRSSSGASNGSAPHCSAKLLSQPFGQPLLVNSVPSDHGEPVVSSSERTFDCNASRLSGGNRLMRWSSSWARMLMKAIYPPTPVLATHEKGGRA